MIAVKEKVAPADCSLDDSGQSNNSQIIFTVNRQSEKEQKWVVASPRCHFLQHNTDERILIRSPLSMWAAGLAL